MGPIKHGARVDPGEEPEGMAGDRKERTVDVGVEKADRAICGGISPSIYIA